MIRLNPYLVNETTICGESYTFSISRIPDDKMEKILESVKKKIGYVTDGKSKNQKNLNGNNISKNNHKLLDNQLSKFHLLDHFDDKAEKLNKNTTINAKKKLSAHTIQLKDINKKVSPTRNSTSTIISQDDFLYETHSKHTKTFSASNIGNILEDVEYHKISDQISPYEATSSVDDRECINGPYYDFLDLDSYFKMLSFSNSCLKMSHYPSLLDQDGTSGNTIGLYTDTNKSTTTGTNTSTDKMHKSTIKNNASSCTFTDTVSVNQIGKQQRQLIPNVDDSNRCKNLSDEEDSNHKHSLVSTKANISDSSEVFNGFNGSMKQLSKNSTFDTCVRDDHYNIPSPQLKKRKSSLAHNTFRSKMGNRTGSSVILFNKKSNVNHAYQQTDSATNRETTSMKQLTSHGDMFVPHHNSDYDLIMTVADPQELISLSKDALIKYICKLQKKVDQLQNPEYSFERRRMTASPRIRSNFRLNCAPSVCSEVSTPKSYGRRGSVLTSALHSSRQHLNLALDIGGTIIEEDDPLAILYKRRESQKK